VLPLKIEIRLNFSSEQEAKKALSNKGELLLRLNYKWSGGDKDDSFTTEHKYFSFKLEDFS